MQQQVHQQAQRCVAMTQTTLLLLFLTGLDLLGIEGVALIGGQTATPYDIIHVTLGLPLSLSCTYNCSSGWVRGHWCLWEAGQADCQPVLPTDSRPDRSGVCVVTLPIHLLSASPSSYNYSCFSQDTNSPDLSRRTERHVLVQVQAPPSYPLMTVPREESGSTEVTCASGGFYPEKVMVTWSLNGTPLKGAKDVVMGPEANGTFSILSTVTLDPFAFQHGGTVTCAINHVTLTQPLRCDSRIGKENPSPMIYYSRDAGSSDKAVPASSIIKTSAGGFLRLYCSVDGHFSSAIQWFRRNSTSQWLNVGTEKTVTMYEVKQKDTGSYMCQMGALNSTVMVAINTPGSVLWLKALAATMLSVAMVLAAAAAFFCITHRTKHRDDLINRNKSEPSAHEGGVTMPAESGCQSEQEVPYADIIISVRGSSSPELSNAPDSAPLDYGKPTFPPPQRWQGETAKGILLHTSRSADRLHVHQREVTRKISTGSEYAIITYYP